MAYWSGGSTDNDYAVTQLGATLLDLKQRMFESTLGAIKDRFPEQALIAHLRALRAVHEQIPKVVPHVAFTVEDLRRAEQLFSEWYSKVEKRIPAKYRAQVRQDAEIEFRAFRVMLGVKDSPTVKW